MTDWTDERDAELIHMRESGATASQIGEVLGVSRRAVSGRVNRLGLAKISPQPPKPKRERVRKPKVRMVADALPMEPDQSWQQAMQSGLEFDAAIPMKQRKGIMELESWHCHFVVGNPQSFDWFYCGAPIWTGPGPYCRSHSLRCYNPRAAR